MKLATSSNIVCDRPDGRVFPLETTLEMAKAAGFQRFDLSFYDWALPHSPFLTDGWERWIDGVAGVAAKLGVSFGQCHAYTYDFLNPAHTDEERRRHEELVHRSILCCKRVGATLCVSHPDTDRTAVDLVASSQIKNTEYFRSLLDFAQSLGMGLAVENMCDYPIAPLRKYGVTAEELVALAEAVNSPAFGVCWDFEHADIMKLDQRASLLYLGRHLMATHVSDTHSDTDHHLMHVMPLFGRVDWETAVRTLKEMGYQGDFCFEAHNYANCLPDPLLPTALRLSHEIGLWLMAL